MLETKLWHGVEVRAYTGRPRSVGDLLTRAASIDADRPALATCEREFTYGELEGLAARFGHDLVSEFGLAPGDRVALLLRNGAAWVTAFFGAVRAGMIVVPLDSRLTPSETLVLLDDCGASAIVTTVEIWEQLTSAKVPGLSGVVAVEPETRTAPRFSFCRACTPGRRLDDRGCEAEDRVAGIFYTSGSTGSAKGAMLTHSNMVHAAINAQRCVGLDWDSRNLVVAPLSHVAPCVSQLVATVLSRGTVHISGSFDARATVRWIVERGVTHFFGVPAMYRLLMDKSLFSGVDLSALRHCAYDGSPSAPELVPELRSALPGIALGHGFGLTESSSVALFLSDECIDDHAGSVGWPCPVNDARVIDGEGLDVAPGEAGELVIRGPTVFAGYWSRPDQTEAAVRGGWLHTGDVARVGARASVHIVDRIKDMIIRGGENVYCIEVENVLQAHPAVAEAALVGVPDRVMGEEGLAIVVPRGGASLTSAEILSFCGERLAPFKVPRHIEIRRSALPRNRGGKVAKPLLRAGRPIPLA